MSARASATVVVHPSCLSRQSLTHPARQPVFNALIVRACPAFAPCMRSSSVLYALVFVLSTLAVSALLRMSRSASSHPARVNLLLKIYLAILVAFELVALYRLHAGHPLHEVCDFIARKKDASFTSLFAAYLQLLTAARLAPLLAPPLQRHAWLACAMTHVAEAFFVVPLAFREGALPPSLGQLLRTPTVHLLILHLLEQALAPASRI